ncbi:MAG: DUF29 domain-containing protein [Acetobacteraceae bacterium]|nr:DUF29 domain-containing protein [Acetobacteraceae bacterium]
MPEDLHDRDILIWSELQADLPRRLARGEGDNGVDWENVVEEIEGVGLSELHSAQSHLNLMLVHLPTVQGWPDNRLRVHWRVEVVACQQNAEHRFAPSMRQTIDLARLYSDALEQLDGAHYDGIAPRRCPVSCPFTLDQLLTERRPRPEQCFDEAARENLDQAT